MNWYTLIVNAVIIGNLLIQHQQLLRLHRYKDLDSQLVHVLFKSYFFASFLFALSSVDFHHLKLPSLPTSPDLVTTENLVCSVLLILISSVFIITIYTTQQLDDLTETSFYSEELERQLLLSTDSFKSTQPFVTVTSSPVPHSGNYRDTYQSLTAAAALRSKDISPIQSYAQQQTREMEETSPKSQRATQSAASPYNSKSRKLSAVKTPILATLLSGDGVIAAVLTDNSDTAMPHWMVALPILISLFYLTSQIVYSVSIVKTNVFTPYRHFLTSGCISVILGLLITGTTLADELSIAGPFCSLIQFPYIEWINYVIGSLLVTQGVVSLVFYVLLMRKRSTSHSGEMISSIQVYNSISSPSLHSVY